MRIIICVSNFIRRTLSKLLCCCNFNENSVYTEKVHWLEWGGKSRKKVNCTRKWNELGFWSPVVIIFRVFCLDAEMLAHVNIKL